jgi:hypothetical protein
MRHKEYLLQEIYKRYLFAMDETHELYQELQTYLSNNNSEQSL